MASITMKDICVSYNKGKTFALKNLSLQVKDGEFCVFLGPSGCGKSTAMHCIAGLLKPESGEVYINKEMVTGPGAFVPPQERNIAMVFQEYALYPNMTVRKNMSFALETRKAPKEEIARKVMHRLKFDNDTIKKVSRLVCYHDYRMAATPKNVRRAMNRIGVELFPYYLAVRMADAKAQSPYKRREKIENIIAIREIYQEILLNKECITLRQLAVSGRELMDLGMQPGRELGSMLSELLEYVIDDPERNNKETLCAYVKEKLGL